MLSLLTLVFLALQALDCIDSLCLLHCCLYDDAVSVSVSEMIGNLILKSKQLKELKVCCCKIAGTAAERCLVTPCKYLASLDHLELSSSVMSDDVVANICA